MLKAKLSAEKKAQIIARCAEYTEANNHGESLRYLAGQIGLERDGKILFHLNAIHDLEGELTPMIHTARELLRGRVMNAAKQAFGADYPALYKAF